MCFALKGMVLRVENGKALVDFDGVRKKVNSEFLDVEEGDRVLVFNGIIIEKV